MALFYTSLPVCGLRSVVTIHVSILHRFRGISLPFVTAYEPREVLQFLYLIYRPHSLSYLYIYIYNVCALNVVYSRRG